MDFLIGFLFGLMVAGVVVVVIVDATIDDLKADAEKCRDEHEDMFNK